MPRKAVAAQNSLVQATVFKKCDRSHHKADSNKGCAAGTCQHTCEAWQAPNCPHKWTVRYSVNSRQREQSFVTLAEAQTFQLTLSTGKQTQGAMFTHPRWHRGVPAAGRHVYRGHGEGQRQEQGHLPQMDAEVK